MERLFRAITVARGRIAVVLEARHVGERLAGGIDAGLPRHLHRQPVGRVVGGGCVVEGVGRLEADEADENGVTGLAEVVLAFDVLDRVDQLPNLQLLRAGVERLSRLGTAVTVGINLGLGLLIVGLKAGLGH